jgi:hypothetical protein
MPLTITFRNFVDTLEAVSVTGVERHFTQGPPESLATAMLPAKWLHNIRGSEGSIVFGEQGGRQGSMSAEIWIAVGPTVQNTQGANFDNSIDLMDNLVTALRAMGLCDLRSKWNIDIVLTVRAVGETNYWTIICTISS